MQTEDVAVAVLRFTSGALGTISATTGAYPGVTTRVELFGDKGSAIIENDDLAYLHLARDDKEAAGSYGTQGQPRHTQQDKGANEQRGGAAQQAASLSARSHALQIADMIRAIREDGTPLVDGYAGRMPVEIILAIYESARRHQEVQLS
jgi:predicted dehydrogenase